MLCRTKTAKQNMPSVHQHIKQLSQAAYDGAIVPISHQTACNRTQTALITAASLNMHSNAYAYEKQTSGKTRHQSMKPHLAKPVGTLNRHIYSSDVDSFPAIVALLRIANRHNRCWQICFAITCGYHQSLPENAIQNKPKSGAAYLVWD